ncbi:unnamed protein product, partial [Phaeothamnion confervicola]
AAEIGCGGGRVAAEVAPHVASLTCLDVSPKMLQRAQAELAGADNVSFRLLSGGKVAAGAHAAAVGAPPRLPEDMTGACDFVYCFDVLVHVDLHVQYAYYRDVRRLLKSGGKAFFSTANLLSPGGWPRFEAQRKFTVGGFYCECASL